VEIGEAERRVVFLARFPRDELLPREDFLQNASRYLSI
jgi:hypothetical protein